MGTSAYYVIVTPFSEFGVKGESITFNVENSTPLNLDEINYCGYLFLISSINDVFEKDFLKSMTYHYYSLYDINGDGIYELIIHTGRGEADAVLFVYTIDASRNEIIKISDFPVTHSWLSTKDGKLYINTGHQYYYYLTQLEMNDDSGSWGIAQNLIREGKVPADYPTYGTALKGYDLSDTSAIEELCPKDLLDAVPNVEGYARVINGECRLYLSGDFKLVSIQTYSNVGDYRYDTEFYSDDEIGEYITLPDTAGTVIVTPYSEAGVKGEPAICYVENPTLLNLDGTNPYHIGFVYTVGDVLFVR